LTTYFLETVISTSAHMSPYTTIQVLTQQYFKIQSACFA